MTAPVPERAQPGIIMVKPHAVDMVLEAVIGEAVGGSGIAEYLSDDDPLRGHFPNIAVDEYPKYRDLASLPYGGKLIDLFYGDKTTRRYFPLITRNYLGKVAFLTYSYAGPKHEMSNVYRAIKGTTETYDTAGNPLDIATGIRGLLGQPYVVVEPEESLRMSDREYERVISPVVNNFIHVCDSESEVTQAMRTIR